MKTSTFSTTITFIFVCMILIIFSGCKKEEDENLTGPTLSITGENIIDGNITTLIGSAIRLTWTADKGNVDLTTFSIAKDGVFLDEWSDAAIPSSQTERYSDSIIIYLPLAEGSYIYTFIVKDKNNKTSQKSVVVIAQKPPITDVFVYYKNSNFLFVIKDGISTIQSTLMTWTVTDYNATTGVATISNELEPSTTSIPLPGTFYFRKTTEGALEYSNDGSNWANLTDVTGSVNFLFGTKAAKPSSLLGSVDNGIRLSSVTYPEGSSNGYMVYSQYNASGNDNYLFDDYSNEYYCEATGFTQAITFTADHSDYPPYTYSRKVELATYKIYLPNGTTREGGNLKPDAPSNLTGSYAYRVDVWNSHTGWYEKHSYINLYWTDNSDNEIQFNVYIKAKDGNYYPLSGITDVVLLPDNFPSNTQHGIVREGYYVDWKPDIYYFKITAFSAVMESYFSNEAAVTVY